MSNENRSPQFVPEKELKCKSGKAVDDAVLFDKASECAVLCESDHRALDLLLGDQPAQPSFYLSIDECNFLNNNQFHQNHAAVDKRMLLDVKFDSALCKNKNSAVPDPFEHNENSNSNSNSNQILYHVNKNNVKSKMIKHAASCPFTINSLCENEHSAKTSPKRSHATLTCAEYSPLKQPLYEKIHTNNIVNTHNRYTPETNRVTQDVMEDFLDDNSCKRNLFNHYSASKTLFTADNIELQASNNNNPAVVGANTNTTTNPNNPNTTTNPNNTNTNTSINPLFSQLTNQYDVNSRYRNSLSTTAHHYQQQTSPLNNIAAQRMLFTNPTFFQSSLNSTTNNSSNLVQRSLLRSHHQFSTNLNNNTSLNNNESDEEQQLVDPSGNTNNRGIRQRFYYTNDTEEAVAVGESIIQNEIDDSSRCNKLSVAAAISKKAACPPNCCNVLDRKNSSIYLSPMKCLSAKKKTKDVLSFNTTPIKNKTLFNYSPRTNSYFGLSKKTAKMLDARKQHVWIPETTSYKVLDAPGMMDDFYLKLIDWSKDNVVGVALSSKMYAYSADKEVVSEVLSFSRHRETISSIAFNQLEPHKIIIGTKQGSVTYFDTAAGRTIFTRKIHQERIGSLVWNDHCFTSGSKDKKILINDSRIGGANTTSNNTGVVQTFTRHSHEICGLAWSPGGHLLASGGNDNKLIIWSCHSTRPMAEFRNHFAAVRGLAWAPTSNGILASGGGSADRTIKIWDTLTMSLKLSKNVQSQVCNLAWSPDSTQLVSTHGYNENCISVWNYEKMRLVTKLKGHNLRVLQLSLSPDGNDAVTGAGDESIRFWRIFNREKQARRPPDAAPDSAILKHMASFR